MLDTHTPIATETAALTSPFDDPECSYLALPDAMRTFVAPQIADWRDNPQGRAVLAQLAEGLKAGQQKMVDLAGQGAETAEFLSQVLGEGEISALADKPGERLLITESVFAGLWRVKLYRDGQLAQDYVETGAFPKVLSDWSANFAFQPTLPTEFPGHLMNAPSLIYELFAKSQAFAPGAEEVINLTLLPMTPEDMEFLIQTLGLAGLSILSRGYGDCRIRQTGLANVWWVQYFNSPGQLILNTLEITAMPNVVMAAPEDLEDSASRLEEFLAVADRPH